MSEAMTQAGAVRFPQHHEYRRQVLIALSLLFVVVAVLASLFIMRNVDSQVRDIRQTYEVRQAGRLLIQRLVDAETGQRGYLLTRDPEYLEPYRDSIASIDRTYNELVALVADSPDELARVEALGGPITEHRRQLAETIVMVAEDRVGEALAVVRDHTGRTRMTEMRAMLNAFMDQESARLAERTVSFEATRIWLAVTMLAALAGSTVLTYLLFASGQRQLAAMTRTSSELQSLNTELEARVRARTAELEDARAHAERERERVETLLQDTNHRVGNSLATVSAMLGLQVMRSSSPDVKAALDAAQDRVQAVASAHRRLRLGADLETVQADEFLSAVVEDLIDPDADERKVRVETRLEPMVIRARDATTVGVVAGELVTNALKHAFPGDRSGEVVVSFTQNSEGTAVLVVEDDGEGMSRKEAGSTESGLGGLIIRQLAAQFKGEPTYEQRPGGGTRVVLPLPDLDVDASARSG